MLSRKRGKVVLTVEGFNWQGNHMKATIDIANPLLEAAKYHAAEEDRKRKDLVEQALRAHLDVGKATRRKFRLH